MKKLILLFCLILSLNSFAMSEDGCPEGTNGQKRVLVIYSTSDSVKDSQSHIEKHFSVLMKTFKKEKIMHTAGFVRKTSTGNQYSLYVLSPTGGDASKEDAMKLVSMDPNVKKELFDVKVQDWIDCTR